MKAERQSALKPKLWSILLLTALAIVAQGSLHAGIDDWTNVGPEGGSLWQLGVDPQESSILYATTGTGVFKSKDGGASWNNAGLNGLNVYTLIIDPQQPTILYSVATNQAPLGGLSVNIFKSADGGTSWNALGSGLPSCCVGALAIDPLNTGTLYAFLNSGLFKSTNAGASGR